MAETIATITVENNITFKRLEDGRTEICLVTDKSFGRRQYTLRDDLKGAGDRLTVKVNKYRKARSLNSNAYFWQLCGRLAEKLSRTKEEIYWEYIREMGIYRTAEISEDAAETIIHIWKTHGLGWIAEKLDEEKHKGFVLINFYYGSSVYNTKQMSRLIDAVVEDCKEQGIETLPPEELKGMIEAWKPRRAATV